MEYIRPEITVEQMEDETLNHSSNKRPGWGPDKDSDEDGHHRPPGQDKYDWFEDDSFYV